MIVTVKTPSGVKSLEEAGYRPPKFGDFLARAIKRRGLSVAQVINETGIEPEILSAILRNERPLDRGVARKLQAVFPKTFRVLLRMQQQSDFYRRYGAIRPSSHLERLNIRRKRQRQQRLEVQP